MRATIGRPATGSTADRGEWNVRLEGSSKSATYRKHPGPEDPFSPPQWAVERPTPESHPRHTGPRSYHIRAEVDFWKFPLARTGTDACHAPWARPARAR